MALYSSLQGGGRESAWLPDSPSNNELSEHQACCPLASLTNHLSSYWRPSYWISDCLQVGIFKELARSLLQISVLQYQASCQPFRVPSCQVTQDQTTLLQPQWCFLVSGYLHIRNFKGQELGLESTRTAVVSSIHCSMTATTDGTKPISESYQSLTISSGVGGS